MSSTLIPSMKEFPILEFDPDKSAKIEPTRVFARRDDIPARCVLTFYQTAVIDGLLKSGKLSEIDAVDGDTGRQSIHVLNYENEQVLVMNPGLGAPSAATFLEILIGMGVDRVVACGHGGVLRRDLVRGSVVIPSAAIRQEGTSYHYLPPAREVEADPQVIAVLEKVLKRHHIRYAVGKTWTTDAIFRETTSTIELRKQEGALVVEMEAAALIAVAKFRRILYGQYIGAGDDVSGDNWDPRYTPERASQKEKLFWLAVEACAAL